MDKFLATYVFLRLVLAFGLPSALLGGIIGYLLASWL